LHRLQKKAGTLQRWSIYNGSVNLVTRSNVCLVANPPSQPSFYAFAYTNVDSDAIPSFNVAGGAEARDNYHDHIVRRAMSMPLA
jgi:hypothetical protein